jgi:hypothetical protein
MTIFSVKTTAHRLLWSLALGVSANVVATFGTNPDEFSEPGLPLKLFGRYCEAHLCEGFRFGLRDYWGMFVEPYVWPYMVANQVAWVLLAYVAVRLIKVFSRRRQAHARA